MKILLTLIVLFFSSSVVAEVLLSNLELYENINNYFSKSEIKKYQSPNVIYGKDAKYSQIYIANPSEKFDENYTLIMIGYENNSKKIHYVGGLNENLNNCLKFRDEKILINESINSLSKKTYKQVHNDGLQQDVVEFYGNNFRIKFTCDYYFEPSPWAGTIDFRYDFLTEEINTWLIEIFETELID